jgi:hypothetical protein
MALAHPATAEDKNSIDQGRPAQKQRAHYNSAAMHGMMFTGHARAQTRFDCGIRAKHLLY